MASSKIENLTASAKAIALAELGDTSKPNASVIVANVNAMRAAIALADRLDEQAILDMHSALLEGEHHNGADIGEPSRSGSAEATTDLTPPDSSRPTTNGCQKR